MTKAEIKTAEKTLKDRTERTEMMAVDGGGWCLSVQFDDGWSKVFYSLEEVYENQEEYDLRNQ